MLCTQGPVRSESTNLSRHCSLHSIDVCFPLHPPECYEIITLAKRQQDWEKREGPPALPQKRMPLPSSLNKVWMTASHKEGRPLNFIALRGKKEDKKMHFSDFLLSFLRRRWCNMWIRLVKFLLLHLQRLLPLHRLAQKRRFIREDNLGRRRKGKRVVDGACVKVRSHGHKFMCAASARIQGEVMRFDLSRQHLKSARGSASFDKITRAAWESKWEETPFAYGKRTCTEIVEEISRIAGRQTGEGLTFLSSQMKELIKNLNARRWSSFVRL